MNGRPVFRRDFGNENKEAVASTVQRVIGLNSGWARNFLNNAGQILFVVPPLGGSGHNRLKAELQTKEY
jgi:hypothetical protein